MPGAASDCSPREQPHEPARRRRAGIGRTRFFLRYARSIAPWLHPPGWLFDILINAFLDQARTALARPLLQAAVQALRTLGQGGSGHGCMR